MDDSLIDSEELSLSRRSVLPGAGFFYPDSFDAERTEAAAAATLSGAETVVIADSDADGLACAALIEIALGRLRSEHGGRTDSETTSVETTDGEREIGAGTEDRNSGVALLGAGPYDLADALARVSAYADPGAAVFVCDICPDDEADIVGLDRLAEHGEVHWYDHHQWDETVAGSVRKAGVDLVVGDSEAECSADVTLRSLDHDFDDRYRELAAVTRDHDLWLREDPRSDDLADLAYWLDADEYVGIVLANGADLPPKAESYLAERRVEKEALIERATERAEFTEIGSWTVGVTYGRCSQNEVAETLRERGADASVIVKPAGSASIRGTDGFERCHEVARQVNGGGHPKAAGCKPAIYDDMLDYAHHWSTQGVAAKRVILAAFERVAETAADEDGIEGVAVADGEP